MMKTKNNRKWHLKTILINESDEKALIWPELEINYNYNYNFIDWSDAYCNLLVLSDIINILSKLCTLWPVLQILAFCKEWAWSVNQNTAQRSWGELDLGTIWHKHCKTVNEI